MSAPVITFFNNKGGVGKTSLVYHLAWMYAEKGRRVVAVDLDPQSNLTAAFLPEERLERLWPEQGERKTVYGSISPLLRGTGDIISEPFLEPVSEELALLPGDLELSRFEDELSQQWPDCLDGRERAFRVISAFSRLLAAASSAHRADIVIVDVGPNLGAINRAALVASQNVVVPLAPDLFSVQALRNLGPTLVAWRAQWAERLLKNPDPELHLPTGSMTPLGYVLLQHGVRLGSPVKAYQRWMARIPTVYRASVLRSSGGENIAVADDEHCLSQLKHYRSLMSMAQDARKPVFALRAADGAFGGHQLAALRAYRDFSDLADAVRLRAASDGGGIPSPPG